MANYSKDELVDLSQLPKAKGWSKPGSTLYHGCWVPSDMLQNVVAFRQELKARDQDVVLASHMKSGTTWMKALLFSLLNRHRYALFESPLLSRNPHELVPSPDFMPLSHSAILSDTNAPDRRLFSTHLHHAKLPKSVSGRWSKCRIVYICRNPLDTILSFWRFLTRGHPIWYGPEWSMEECVETFCKGESMFGPFWEHVLGFWKASLEAPEKVLFLTYEDLLEDTAPMVKRVAEFLGFPFSEEEEESGVVEEIIEVCSLRKMKELDVNKPGKSTVIPDVENELFFGEGKVGDWVNHLSPSMVESVNKVIEEKLQGSGLTFKYSL